MSVKARLFAMELVTNMIMSAPDKTFPPLGLHYVKRGLTNRTDSSPLKVVKLG
jgi:hypothetical protein